MSDQRAIFLDRDGTLNESVGYVNHASRFRLYPWSVDAVRTIKSEGYLAVMVTNQSGIGRGFFTDELLRSVHAGFEKKLDDAGTGLDGIYYCPHEPRDGCPCRKPKDGMLRQASDELGIDLERSWIVGDTVTDLEAGWTAGARGALVKTGFGAGTLQFESDGWARQPDLVADNVYRAVCDIVWGSAV